MPAWLAPLASAALPVVGNLVSKLFGGDDEQSSRVDYKQMVRDAEAAGFNPLTVLRAGGASGYTTQSHPALSTASMIGDGIAAVGNVLNNFDIDADKRRKAEFDLVNAQIENIQTETAQRRASMNAPKRVGSNAVTHGGAPVSDSSLTPIKAVPALAAGDKAFEMGQVSVTNPSGGRWWVDPTVGDAQHLEDRYGEPGSWLGGVYVGAKDAAYNIKKSAPLGTSKSFNDRINDMWSDPVKYMKRFNEAVEADLAKPWAW